MGCSCTTEGVSFRARYDPLQGIRLGHTPSTFCSPHGGASYSSGQSAEQCRPFPSQIGRESEEWLPSVTEDSDCSDCEAILLAARPCYRGRMTELPKRRPLLDWSEEELLQTISEHERIVLELDVLIDQQKTEVLSQLTFLSDADALADAVNEPHLAELRRTRKEAAASVEEIERELQRRKSA